MYRIILYALIVSFASVSSAQLTTDQKVVDFLQLSGLYAKNYAPYEWKRDTLGFDLLNTSQWLDQVRQSKNDLDFYETCIRYVAALNDAHDVFTLPSDFSAYLGFDVDIYDGKLLIESIDRSLRPRRSYQFQLGDEVVSVDGKSAEEWLQELAKYAVAGNSRSTRREAAALITYRPQALVPTAASLPDHAIVLFRRQNGDLEYYEVPWEKSGVPLLQAGPVPAASAPMVARKVRKKSRVRAAHNLFGIDELAPSYMEPLRRLQNVTISKDHYELMGLGSFEPIFVLPENFRMRLGESAADNFFSGTFRSGNYQIGFLRIATMTPATTTAAALRQLEAEMTYFQANTDGLIIDVMRNPGGTVAYTQELLRRLIAYPFHTIGFEIRATSNWVASISSALETAKAVDADQWVIDLYEVLLADIRQANRENRGRTGPESLAGPTLDVLPATDRTGKPVAYTKPLLVLTDEFSASGAEQFAAVIQDTHRGKLFGMRTTGAGGSVVDFDAGAFSEARTRVTVSLMHRQYPVVTPDYPTASYVENIGVRPDIEADYMTEENLMNDGQAFVESFTAAITDLIANSGN